MGPVKMKEELRCVLDKSGELFVTCCGTEEKQK